MKEKPILKVAGKITYVLCKGISLVVPVLLIAIMLIVVANVVLRALVNTPIVGTSEIVECMIACAGFLSMGWCTFNNMNIRVDILSRRLHPTAAKVVEGITSIASFAIVPLLFWQHLIKTLNAFSENEMSDILRFSMYPVYAVVTVGFFVLIFAQLYITVKAIIGGDEK